MLLDRLAVLAVYYCRDLLLRSQIFPPLFLLCCIVAQGKLNVGFVGLSAGHKFKGKILVLVSVF